jgi:hypothetical protein
LSAIQPHWVLKVVHYCKTGKSDPPTANNTPEMPTSEKERENYEEQNLKVRHTPIMNDAFKAHILEFDLDTDDEYYDSEDDDLEETWKDLEEEYDRKEDADVAVFLALVEDMPIESRLHLLQGHARSLTQGQPENYAQETKKHEKPQVRPEKRFRWAEETDSKGEVKRVVHEIEPVKDLPELWFSTPELDAIRRDLIRQIRFFTINHQERIAILDRIVIGEDPESLIEEHMKSLTKHSIGRGLEGHMSKLIPQNRHMHMRGVLQAQIDCNVRQNSYDETIEKLREQSLIKTMGLYARRMGKCDEIEALTASMSHWEGTDTTS